VATGATTAEWPLAAVAVVFLAAFSVEVLAQPTGAAAVAVDVVTWTVWGIFAVDYVVRLALAPDRRRWFLHHLLDLAVVALPLLRPLRLLRLVVLVAAFQQAIGNAGAVWSFTPCRARCFWSTWRPWRSFRPNAANRKTTSTHSAKRCGGR
jgi:hypothetical protein